MRSVHTKDKFENVRMDFFYTAKFKRGSKGGEGITLTGLLPQPFCFSFILFPSLTPFSGKHTERSNLGSNVMKMMMGTGDDRLF